MCDLSFSSLRTISLLTFVIMPILTIYTIQNHRFGNSRSFVLINFEDVSLGQCMFECKKRPGCKAVEYRYLIKYCSLRSENKTLLISPGFMVVYGFVNEMRCGDSTCRINEACEIDSLKCVIVECSYPEFDMLDLKGNIFQVGSKLESNCVYAKQYTCNATGHWERKTQLRFSDLSCRDIRLVNNGVLSGNYINSLENGLYCDYSIDDGDWIVFQRRLDGSVDFFRTWQDYKTGFGDICGEFWLGLENIYTIQQSSPFEFELRVDLTDWEGGTSYALYDSFHISNESEDYTLNIGSYTGTNGDSLRYHNGKPFSTKDRGHSNRCAISYLGAWWYGYCHRSNLNGFYYPGPNVPKYASGVSWKSWKNTHNYSMKAVSMKMREKRQGY